MLVRRLILMPVRRLAPKTLVIPSATPVPVAVLPPATRTIPARPPRATRMCLMSQEIRVTQMIQVNFVIAGIAVGLAGTWRSPVSRAAQVVVTVHCGTVRT